MALDNPKHNHRRTHKASDVTAVQAVCHFVSRAMILVHVRNILSLPENYFQAHSQLHTPVDSALVLMDVNVAIYQSCKNKFYNLQKY